MNLVGFRNFLRLVSHEPLFLLRLSQFRRNQCATSSLHPCLESSVTDFLGWSQCTVAALPSGSTSIEIV